MQNVVSQLQDIISRHYGLPSELELKPLSSYQSLKKELYSQLDQSISIPIFEPKTTRPIAYFKIGNVVKAEPELIQRLQDLVQMTLQSYLDLVDKMEVSENILQYLQMELNPHKILRMQKETPKKSIQRGSIQLGSTPLAEPRAPLERNQSEVLLLSKSRKLLDNLAVHIHDTARNQFFIRTDHMPESFMTRINDLTGLEQTTLYIPRIYELTSLQQKTLETYFLMEKNRSNTLLIVAGTRLPAPQLIAQENISEGLLQHFHLFHLVSEGDVEGAIGFQSLSQCASAVLEMKTGQDRAMAKNPLNLTKSYNLIPSLRDFFPTIH